MLPTEQNVNTTLLYTNKPTSERGSKLFHAILTAKVLKTRFTLTNPLSRVSESEHRTDMSDRRNFPQINILDDRQKHEAGNMKARVIYSPFKVHNILSGCVLCAMCIDSLRSADLISYHIEAYWNGKVQFCTFPPWQYYFSIVRRYDRLLYWILY